ncbi:TlpA disulfide reductase family protein [Pedobacter sp. BMA]|uniref:TlpA disulfide reductase family protein n=1 Tax=Pedobacter sp. BMA TaxID=1663685 RepID=UPI000649E6E2|nr:TlpA disulfide reductase family protein [Pedobacter sp. BMA]KLT66649.1 redoxin [Pedobacter sp. BMA]
MKNITIVLLLFVSAILQAQAQAVITTPEKIQRGDSVTITYNPAAPGASIPADAPSVTIVFTYSTFYDLPWKMPMIKKGNLWTASFKAGRFATFATFYLQSGEMLQKPAADKHYTLPVYQGNQRIKNSLLHESYSLSTQMPKAPDLQQHKLDLINQELTNNPDNYEAKVAQMVVKMALAKSPAEKLQYRELARKIIAARLEENPTLPGNMNQVTMGYLMIGEKTRLDSVRKVVMERYPSADLSKDLRASIISREEKNTTVKIAKLEAMLKKGDQPGEEGSESIHKMLFDLYAANGDSVKALAHASKLYAKINPYTPETYKSIVVKLTESKIAPVAAISYANKALAIANQWPVGIIRYFPEFGYIPSYVPDSTRRQAVADATAALLSIKALNYLRLKNTDSAKVLTTRTLQQPANREATINAAQVLSQLGEHEQAFNALWKLLIKNPTDSLILAKAKTSFLSYNKSEESFRAKVQELEVLEIQQLTAKTKTLMMNKPGPELSGLTDLQGNPVAAAMMKGKVVILDFWATWCVPCMQEMPYFHKVFEKYQNNPNVMFMVVNSGANNTINDARNWVKQNPQYKFPVYFNNDKNIGEKVGFTLIPTIAVIDQEGKMQFRTIGFEGEILQKKLDVEIAILLDKK